MQSRLIPLAASCALALLGACHAQRDAAPAAVVVVPVAGIELREPRPELFTAGQPAPSGWTAIAARGVTTVVNLRTPKEMEGRDEAAAVQAAGMRYVSIPVAGADGIAAANADALGAARRSAQGPVLVQGASGNRVGGLLALMAVREEGASAEQAIALGRAAGMASTESRVRALLGAPASP